ncbi:antA/AntB antirepressor family protein [Sphingobacterium sp. UBA2074]|uniref:antA/AntB antirepressor family protein n=1 Tax=Sphingobacterium sp. UBA2074 TaxID=1947487 RepID=UPI00257D20FD|nr:antA/AntB antirepressor family protein [Sphingobacterium sp. UBA2074]
MKELIKITENENLGQAVSARELHEFVVKSAKGGQKGEDFSNWIKRMLEYGYEFGRDYITIEYDYLGNILTNTPAEFSESDNQLVSKRDYILTIDTAKEIGMLQKNDKGREIRRYFIQCERLAKSVQNGIGIEYRDGKLVLPTSSISSTTGILHDELMRLIKKYLDEHTEVSGGIRKPIKGHLKKGKFLIENVWELNIFNNKGIPHKEYVLTRDGFNYLVKWHGFLAFSGFLPHYSREFEIDAYQQHIKSLE